MKKEPTLEAVRELTATANKTTTKAAKGHRHVCLFLSLSSSLIAPFPIIIVKRYKKQIKLGQIDPFTVNTFFLRLSDNSQNPIVVLSEDRLGSY